MSNATQSSLNQKQNNLIIVSLTGGSPLVIGNSIRGIIPSSPITITDTGSTSITLGLSSTASYTMGGEIGRAHV